MNSLSLLIFIPIFAAVIIAITSASMKWTRLIALSVSFAIILITVNLFIHSNNSGAINLEVNIPWIASYGIAYHIGLDGFSLTIMMLIAILLPLTFIFMFNRSTKGMFIAMLFAQGGATGALFSLDMILFYLFWETMLLPIFIMIGLYGIKNRQKVALRITLYTIFGSLAMLFAILVLAFQYYNVSGFWSFNLHTLAQFHTQVELPFWIYIAFLSAFLIKIPLFGFHGWLKSSYESSPTPTLIILSGIMAKLGVYTIYRFIFLLFPQEVMDSAVYLIGLALLGMIYFGIAAIMQKELRILFAYSSASHMSLIIVGLFTLNIYGASGALYLITAHALATGGLFLILAIIAEQTQSTMMHEHSGIIHQSPWLGVLLTLFALSIVGIPGSSGFVAELLIIIGSFHYNTIIGFFTATTVVIAMTFILWMLQRMVFGPISSRTQKMKAISQVDGITLSFLAFIIYFMGVAPDWFITNFEYSIIGSLSHFGVNP